MSETTTAPKKAAAKPADEQPKEASERATATGVSEVKYIGSAGVREITQKQWADAGVDDQATTTWDANNEYTLPGSDFTDNAITVLRRDKKFRIVAG